MEEETLKKFELNNSILKDFDKLMTMHLDEIEELKVTEISAKSKLLNIISLCTNVKTLIIEGDQRINTNSIVANLCKPEILEDLILTNVKLPTEHSIKKLTGLKIISLNNICYNKIVPFLEIVPEPEKIEGIKLRDVSFENHDITVLNRFTNLKYLNLDHVTDINLIDLEFLNANQNLEKVKINNNQIEIHEINNLLKGNMKKEISLIVLPDNDELKIKNKLEILEDGTKKITINSMYLDELTKQVQLFRIDELYLVMDREKNIVQYIKPLKRAKKALHIIIKDCSYLTVEDAQKLQERLKVETIDILDIDGKQIEKSYTMESYINFRVQVDSYIKRVTNKESTAQKFLEIYKILGETLKIDDKLQTSTSDITSLDNALAEKKVLSTEFSQILQSCLSCMGIESNIIKGIVKKTEKEHYWNQVKIDGKWYNVDIAMDSKYIAKKNIFRRNAKYCLLSDKTFYGTHIPRVGENHFAEENFDRRILNVFFKTGIFDNSLLKSYFSNLLKNIKHLTKNNNVVLLPSGNEEESKK